MWENVGKEDTFVAVNYRRVCRNYNVCSAPKQK